MPPVAPEHRWCCPASPAVAACYEALVEAADCLEEAIAGRIDDDLDIPEPSEPVRGERMVNVPAAMALKAAVYLSVREAGISNSELARRLRVNEKEARRILDPHHPTKLSRIEAALAALGRHIELALA
jgi:antitoxin HicB